MKWIVIFSILLATYSASAAPISQCSPGVITLIDSEKDVWVETNWVQPASFPNPSKSHYFMGLGKNITIVCPNFTARFDAKSGKYTFIGKTLKDIFSYSGFGGDDASPGVNFYNDGYNFASMSFSYVSFSYDRSINFRALGDFDPPSFLMVYKIDKGKRLPLFFDGKQYGLIIPRGSKFLEVFAPSGPHAGWQYLSIDFTKSTLILKHENPFPTK